MRQRELIDYCTDDANRCDGCPYDAECDVYFDMYGTTPACEERNHPERYTDEDIGLMDKELAIREQPTIQPEKAQLSQEGATKDAISRQSAIDEIEITSFDDYGDYMRARELIEQLPSAQPEPQWIPIERELPRDGSWNIFTDGKNISVERYKADAIDHFFPAGRWFQLEDVIAWMPLPSPYQKGATA